MGLRGKLQWLKFIWDLKNAIDKIEEEEDKQVGYDVTKTLGKGLGRLFLGAALSAIPVVTAYLSDPTAVSAAFAAVGVKPVVATAAATVIVALAKMVDNFRKNKDK